MTGNVIAGLNGVWEMGKWSGKRLSEKVGFFDFLLLQTCQFKVNDSKEFFRQCTLHCLINTVNTNKSKK